MARKRWRPTPRRFPVSTPGAEAEWTLSNDKGALWLIRAVAFTLATSAAAPVRTVGLRAQAAEDVWWRTVPATTQAATLTRNYHGWLNSVPTGDSAVAILLGWPPEGLWLPPGHSLGTQTVGLDAADQYSAIIVDLVEYPEVLPEHLVPSPNLYTEDSQE